MDWRRLSVHAPLVAVILAALAAYSNSFHSPFVLDNDQAIVQDARVHKDTSENIARIFGEPYQQYQLSNLYRPLTGWTYLLNYSILGGGVDPSGYHWLNFLLHAINIVLVYALALALFEDRTAALAASALWGLHPVLVESVASIAGRADMLAALGILAGLLCYRAAADAAGLRRAVWIAGVFFATALAVFSKESGIAAIGVIAAYDQIFLRERPSKPRLAAFLAAAVPSAAFLAIRAAVLGRFPAAPIPFVDNPLTGATFWPARITAFKVIGKCFGLLLWPARLSVDYSYNEIPVAIDAKGFLGLALCLAAAGLGLWAARRHKPLFFAIALFFLALAPVGNVFLLIGAMMAERFLYLPAAGFVLAIVYGLSTLAARRPRIRTAVAAAVCVLAIACAARAYVRNGDWSSGERLWGSVVGNAPHSYKGHISYAAALPLIKANDRNRAVAEVAAALDILDKLPDAQNMPDAYRMAGSIYRQMGDEVALHRAEPDGSQPNDWYDKALNILFRSDAIEQARNEAYIAYNQRRGTPRSTFLPSSIYFEIGRTYLRKAQQLQALSFYEKGRGLEPNADLLEDEAATLASYGDYRKAAQTYIEALEVDSSRADLGERIVEMYTKLDPNGCAVSRQGGAPSLNPKCPMVHDDICGAARNVENTFARRGQMEDAASIRRVAIVDLGCTGVSGQ